MIYFLLTLSSISAAFGQIFLKKGSTNILSVYMLVGLFLYFLGFVIWVYCLSKISLTVVYSFTLLTFLLVFLFSAFILNERINFMTYLGIAVVFIGFSLILRGQTA